MEILDINNIIASQQQSHLDKENIVDLINIKRIKDIIVKAYFQAAKFKKDSINIRAKKQFFNKVQELAKLVEASSYPSTQILKPLPKAPKPLPSGENGTGPINTIGTASTGTAPAGVIAGDIIDNGIGRTDIGIDPYKLNKLNIGKPGFTNNREIIIEYKFKYFKKGNKKGQIYNRQLFVAIGL